MRLDIQLPADCWVSALGQGSKDAVEHREACTAPICTISAGAGPVGLSTVCARPLFFLLRLKCERGGGI